MLKNQSKDIRINPSLLRFTKHETIDSFLDLVNTRSLINSFPCESDSTLAAGEYSFLIYGGQHLTLYNVDSQLCQIPWDTNRFDSIKHIRWSSYHRSYLIMTARLFFRFDMHSYELFEIKRTFPSYEQLQLFTCHQTDLWLLCLLTRNQRQILLHYNLFDWERSTSETKHISLDQLGLYRTDSLCAMENDRTGEILALLIAERNQNITVGIQRRRRLILTATHTMSPIRVIYFSGADDLYWTLTFVPNHYQKWKSGWLLSKYFENEITFVNHQQIISMDYEKALRNVAITMDGHYLIFRTIDSLDIYQIY